MKETKPFLNPIGTLGEKIIQQTSGLYERIFPQALEKRFVKEWTAVLVMDAKVYTGMYTSLTRVARDESKKPEKVLREWVTRTTYQWEDGPITKLCGRTLTPAVESGQDCAKWAKLLLRAAHRAGVTKDHKDTVLTLDDTSILAYTEWDGEDIYPGDTVKVVIPAWYQNGRVLEQGQCTLIADEETSEAEQE